MGQFVDCSVRCIETKAVSQGEIPPPSRDATAAFVRLAHPLVS